MKFALNRIVWFAIGLLANVPLCHGATVPFVEDFTSGVANWADISGGSLLSHVAGGGPDGGAYATTRQSLVNLTDQNVALFRAQDEFNSSAHAFEGNWLAQQIGQFSTYVRHNAPLPLNFFTRFSGPGNFPGAAAVKFAPVLPNTWTLLNFAISPGNPEFVTFEGSNFNAVFSNVGHIQVGVTVPAALGSNPALFTFDIDKAAIVAVPEPSCCLAGLMAGTVLCLFRRRGASQ